jgi:sulfur carrier protein
MSIISSHFLKEESLEVIINGKLQKIESNLTLEEIIKNLKNIDEIMACAVNMDIVKRDEWCNYIPQKNDTIELLTFATGA